MKLQTIQQLNSINKVFYETVSHEFDETRQQPWPGWERLSSDFPNKNNLSILDVGCGNARFAEFLSQHKASVKRYIGIDSDSYLLEQAKKCELPFDTQFIEFDIVQNLDKLSIQNTFDVIVLFGVIHHIPSFELRQRILNKLSQHLATNGLLIFSAWQFLTIPSLKKRIVDWNHIPEIEVNDLEPNDYVLDWQRGTQAFRYCHLVDEEEVGHLVKSLQLTKVEQFYSDGKNGESNLYVVLKKES